MVSRRVYGTTFEVSTVDGRAGRRRKAAGFRLQASGVAVVVFLKPEARSL
jgi:hypothetical protein